MGKGDKKTRRGKINQGSYGKTRPKKSSKPVMTASEKPAKAKAEPKAKTAKPKAEKPAEEKPKAKRTKKAEE